MADAELCEVCRAWPIEPGKVVQVKGLGRRVCADCYKQHNVATGCAVAGCGVPMLVVVGGAVILFVVLAFMAMG